MTAPFFSRATEEEVGSFYYPLGMVAFTLSEPAKAVVERIRSHQPIRVEDHGHEELLRIAYEVTSLFHEMRHYFDMFGTTAGISLFLGRLSLLRKFVQIGQTLNAARMPWTLPLGNWAASGVCPEPIRHFIRHARTFEAAEELYVAPFAPLEVEGHTQGLTVDMAYEGGDTVVAFPLRIARVRADGEARLRSVLHPIGLEALLEGNAHAVCREMSSHCFPPEIARELTLPHRMTISHGDTEGTDTEQAVAQSVTSYMVTDLLISKHFANHGILQFPRDLILSLTDRVLTTGVIQTVHLQHGATGIQFDRLGNDLVDLLVASDLKALAAAAQSTQPEVDHAYDGLLASLERRPDWDGVKDDDSLLSSLAIWEAYVAKHCVVPLLQLRQATSNRAFRGVSDFLNALNVIGSPPVRVANGKLLIDSLPARVQSAWWHHLVLGEVLRQLVRGNTPVFCPRAHSLFPGIDSANLSFEGECRRHMPRGCGTFREAPVAFQPNCLFENVLNECGLKRPQ
ncbi:hypothetical protein QTH97_32160 [Variovorax sp. J22R24]|uniref:hypothetical protein n=1 Tax=Variovorax gracilis TaxID=3053502 RepID=UPI002574D180|nr:hypothetical protein [Variovorax sp. J22R24]MDM0109614.1 hypothetical protein [Variovorax sp. J22R24]